MRIRNGVARPRATRGGATEADADMISNGSLGFKALGASKPRLCERCGQRKAGILVVGEREGQAVWVCAACRSSRRLPMMLTMKGRAR